MARIIFSNYWLGSVTYQDGLHIQRHLANIVKADHSKGFFLYLEHPAVITVGRNASSQGLRVSQEELQARNIDYIASDRGGQITLHHPGQLMIYAIFHLASMQIGGVRGYVEFLETSIISYLQDLGIMAYIDHDYPGIWVRDQNHPQHTNKICALGLSIPRGISQHGLALNVYNDLSDFHLIHPCGIRSQFRGITSIWKTLQKHQTSMTNQTPHHHLIECSKHISRKLQQNLASCSILSLQRSDKHQLLQSR